MQKARVILCEKNGTWAVALRRELSLWAIRVYETRSHGQCLEEAALSPHSFIAVEVMLDSVESSHRFVARLRGEFPSSSVVILGTPDTEPYEFALREAGAIFATFSPRRLSNVATLAHRHLTSVAESASSIRDSVFENLPWGETY